MTTTDPLDTIRHAISTLERTVNGDPTMNVKSLRLVTEELKTGLDQICRERATEAAEKRGQNRAIGWIFGSSLASVVGMVVLLLKTFGTGGGA